MDPREKWNAALNSGSPRLTITAASQEVVLVSEPCSSQQLRMSFSAPSPGAGTSAPAPLPEGLAQQHYREEKSLLRQRRWERLGLSQKKKGFRGQGHMRRRHRDHMAPYAVERNTGSSVDDRAHSRIRCDCRYCQGHGQHAGVSGERNATGSSSSWDSLVQGLSGLTLSMGTNQPGLLPEGAQQQQQLPRLLPPEERCPRERQQENKKMFQRLLKQWLKDN
ncbi:protein FAM156A/FAM156B-like [Perognathus longimembris pacificus]|uniref:protein FAM156A/FAM156B n=1 Tax=Perognathus longimembris pacificus TaxID=214514 RepID=UPI0020195BBF|nr:protein FAM156A/FAM156B [Perognathus longimembris pacificus]XP_048191245.1 protein FAM156A/FAM156B [Perognathus longimembris pacificus]XP_048191246.1 protein FAM156A/FAM156B [Perognathus longimembris pacificus]XP_048191247.1 protein FAM156A/FAM156B [Perognathus longimembris pacificus]XP_048191248.1 protein FAM156A/FAM156B-like [Perognathus longimembris pacificus]XP_048191250.1 protein FAM156A/FAM156B-like [Perognathus longimembris pacificus]XP_048191251.1 protein FAM156A/FAM156B-like [Pero